MAFTLNGTSRLARTLHRAGGELKDLKPVNRDAAELALEEARRLAPEESGLLKSTLRVGATNRAGIVRAGNNRSTNGVPYAGPVHWGWPDRGITANPFMLHAARNTEPQWVALYERYADQVLNKVKGA